MLPRRCAYSIEIVEDRPFEPRAGVLVVHVEAQNLTAVHALDHIGERIDVRPNLKRDIISFTSYDTESRRDAL